MTRNSKLHEWLDKNRDIKDRTWQKMLGTDLTREHIGREIKFPNPIEWETEIQSVHGILTYVADSIVDSYYFYIKVDSSESHCLSGAFYGNVYDMDVYVKK